MEMAQEKTIANFLKSVIVLMIAGVMTLLLSRVAFGLTLQKVEILTAEDKSAKVKLSFDSAPPEPKSYTLKKPARIVVDLPDTLSKVNRYYPVYKGGIERLTVVQAGGKTRLIVALDKLFSLKSTVEGQSLLLAFSKEVAGNKLTKEKVSNIEEKKEKAPKEVLPQLRAVDFQRGKDDAGNVIFLSSQVDPVVSIDSKGQQLTLDFPGLKLPDILNQRLDVTEFATPVQFIRLKQSKGKVQAFVELAGKYEYLSWQSGKKFTLSVHEIAKDKTAGSGELTHVGEKLSLNFQNIEIRAVLQLLADEQNFNLVASDAVKGNVTLRLEDVPWDQALNIILRSKGLDKRLEGNVLTVAPAKELASRERQSLESSQQIKDLSPLHTELIQINYANANDMATVLKGTENNRILSERGSVQVVERTNSLLVNETKDKLIEIQALMQEIDIPVKQVMIEARIVEAETNLREELGVQWGKTAVSPTLNASLPGNKTLSNVSGIINGSSAVSDMFIALPVADPTSGITFGYVTDSVNLSLQLSALETDSKVEIISRPQVITANKKKAVIRKGQERAFETTSDQGTNTTFKDITLALEVTPQITPDGRIIMDVDISNNDVTGTDSKGNPITSINEINTQLLVNDGQTVVLGGIFKNTLTKRVESVPLLGSLPGIGSLFRKDIDGDLKSELLVFITPRIVTESLAKK